MSPTTEQPQPRALVASILTASALIVAFLFWLIYYKPVSTESHPWVGWLPQLNAALNFTSFCLVILGLRAIFRGDKRTHKVSMMGALTASGAFLISYVTYHNLAGHSTFQGEGLIKGVYFFILISHILLSVVLVPLLLLTVSFAALKQYNRHKAIARWTFPIWLYVSLTGVLVFVLLRGFGLAS